MADKKSIGEKEKGLNFMQRLLQNDNARKIIVVVGVVAILGSFSFPVFLEGIRNKQPILKQCSRHLPLRNQWMILKRRPNKA